MPSFRHFAIRTSDIERSRRFYEEGLGMKFVSPRNDSLDLSDGYVNLTLIPYEGPPRAPAEEGSEFMHVGFLVDDLAATYRRLVDQGATIAREDVKERRKVRPDTVPTGSFKVLDPDGNVIDISERPDEWRT